MRYLYDGLTVDSDRLNIEKWIKTGKGTVQVAGGVGQLIPNANEAIHAYAQIPRALNGEILTKIRRISSSSTQRFRLIMRSDTKIGLPSTGNERTNTCIGLIIDNAGLVTLQKVVNATSTTLVTAQTLMPTLNVWYNVRFSIDAGWIRVRVWADGGAEPGTWNYSVADDGTVPAGVPELVYFRSSTQSPIQFGPVTISGTKLRSQSGPKVYRYPDGSIVPYGRGKSRLRDEAMESATPSWITGTLVHTAGEMLRVLNAGASATAQFSLPAIDTTKAKRIALTLENFRLSSDTGVSAALQVVGTSTWQLTQAATDTNARLTDGTLTASLEYRFLQNSEGPRHRNLTLWLLPEKQQLVAWQDDKCIGWLDLGTVSGNVTPTVVLTATGASARSLSFSACELAVERQ